VKKKKPVTSISEHTATKQFECPITGDIISIGQTYKRLNIAKHGAFTCSLMLENDDIEEFAEEQYLKDILTNKNNF